jgi:hypothetical protein
MKRRVLWIEDGAYGDLPDVIGPVVVDGGFDLDIALDATGGVEKILANEYQCVIVDIRLPPGSDTKWIEIYNHPNKYKDAERLGLLVLRSVLTPEQSVVRVANIPAWVHKNKSKRFGVLTVENQNEVESDLDELKIKVYRQKSRRPSVNTLLELVEEVLRQS